jgi:hypothetical protein
MYKPYRNSEIWEDYCTFNYSMFYAAKYVLQYLKKIYHGDIKLVYRYTEDKDVKLEDIE